jgi:hypothetical protein
MIRKCIISGFIVILLSGISLFSQDIADDGSDKVFSAFEERFKAVEKSLSYLKEKNMDSEDISSLYAEAEGFLKDLKQNTVQAEQESGRKFLSHLLSVIEEKSFERVVLAKRMDTLYIIMVSLGIIIIAGMSIYSVFMYMRRR